ncbi:hypothetical protein D3C76_03770 [compost metagenome]
MKRGFNEVFEKSKILLEQEKIDKIDSIEVFANLIGLSVWGRYVDQTLFRVHFYKHRQFSSNTVIYTLYIDFKEDLYRVSNRNTGIIETVENFEKQLEKIMEILSNHEVR